MVWASTNADGPKPKQATGISFSICCKISQDMIVLVIDPTGVGPQKGSSALRVSLSIEGESRYWRNVRGDGVISSKFDR